MMKKTIDSYINSFSKEEKAVLEELRQIILSVFKFEECIYYNIPAFRYKGEYVVAFRMHAHHIGFYPCSGSILNKFKDELKNLKTSIGAVQFPKGKRFPILLIKKIIKARMREISQAL
jgi:uncharacterized protein YdhG (YjbR/CyaY superfamily)